MRGEKMAIYHLTVSSVSRGKGGASTGSLAYIISEKVYDERLGITFYSHGRKERVVEYDTILPEEAPERYRDPANLFNEVEMFEKSSVARTAKKIEVALPRELGLEQQREIVRSFIKENLAEKGYAATYAIHCDEDRQNPHAHILVANRPLEHGEWQKTKTRKEYVRDEHGNRIPVLDKTTGIQKVDAHNRKQWQRKTVKQHHLERKETLIELRKSWAHNCNKYLSPEQQIDHRSNRDRGIEAEPTIHEGYAAKQIKAHGGVSDRIEINEEIKARNLERRKKKHEQLRDLIQRSRDTRAAAGVRKADPDDKDSFEREYVPARSTGRDERELEIKRADDRISARKERDAEQQRLRIEESQRVERERLADLEKRREREKRIREEERRIKEEERRIRMLETRAWSGARDYPELER